MELSPAAKLSKGSSISLRDYSVFLTWKPWRTTGELWQVLRKRRGVLIVEEHPRRTDVAPDVAWKVVTNLRLMTSHPCHEGLYETAV